MYMYEEYYKQFGIDEDAPTKTKWGNGGKVSKKRKSYHASQLQGDAAVAHYQKKKATAIAAKEENSKMHQSKKTES